MTGNMPLVIPISAQAPGTHTHVYTDIVIHSSVFDMQMSQALPDQGPDLAFA